MVSCRICKGDHWTTKCPYKDSLAPLQESLDADKKKDEPAANAAQQASAGGPRPGKYVPPSLREGGNRKGESMSLKNRGLCLEFFIELKLILEILKLDFLLLYLVGIGIWLVESVLRPTIPLPPLVQLLD